MPIINELISMVNEIRGWIILAFAAVTALRIAWEGMGYQEASEDERVRIKKNIRGTLKMAGGIFVLISFVFYIINRFAGTVA